MAVAGRDKRLFQLSWNFFSYLKGEEEKNKIKENNFQRLLEYFFYPCENIPGSAFSFLSYLFFVLNKIPINQYRHLDSSF
jgi:hypothetical protein